MTRGLLAGIALHRLGRTAEAGAHLESALARMDEAGLDELCDVSILLDREEAIEYARLSPEDRRAWEVTYWAARDRDHPQRHRWPWVGEPTR